MNDLQFGSLQFRCKLCKFIGTNKGQIAEHFLDEHTEVEYVPQSKKVKSEEETGSADGVQDKLLSETPTQKKRGRPKGKSSSSAKKPSVKNLTPADVTNPNTLGRGKRKRKKKAPLDMTNEVDEAIESLSDDESIESDDGDENLEEGDGWVAEDGGDKSPPNFIRVKLRTKKQGRGRPKKNKRGKGKMGPNTKTGKPLPLVTESLHVYSTITNGRIKEWQETYVKKNSDKFFHCPQERCSKHAMSEPEFAVHTQCHVPNMEGFRCVVCQFMCLHWRNMRHHYRKSHDQMTSKVTCDFEECGKEFPRMASLRTHVLMVHIKQETLEKLREKQFRAYLDEVDPEANPNHDPNDGDSTAVVDSGQDKVDDDDVEEEEGTSMEKGRGRPPKGKRPVGRPRKNPAPVSTLLKLKRGKRARGEEREKLHRRLIAFVCDICHAKYNDEETMLKHKFSHFHEGSEGEIHCTECEGFVAPDETAIREHMYEVHKSMLQLHRCEICNFSSSRFHDLKKHRIVHTGEKNFMCDKCGKCTTTPYNLKVHYRRMHATDDEKNIACFECDYRCADKAVLKDHIRQKHGMLVNGDEYQNPRSLLLFPCTECDYVGRKQSSLDYHMRIHNENRQFKCHLCPYASKTKNNLALHIRTHDGLRPLKCPHCEFRGATNKIIAEHVMCKHAKTRPYTCNICQWSTAYSGNMWKHVDTHQKELGPDKMPAFPVNVISTDGHSVPTPLRAPTGKRRSGKSEIKLKLMKKRGRSKVVDIPQGTISILQGSSDVQTMQMAQVQTGGNLNERVFMQMPVTTVVHDGQVMVTDGLTEEESMGSTALSRLAAAVASAQEVHIITPEQALEMEQVESVHEQQIITTQIETLPTTIQAIQVGNGGGSDGMTTQEIVQYKYSTIPGNVAQQIITSGGEITQVITTDHVYHAQQHEHHQQQQQHQHQQLVVSGSIQQAAIHAGIPTSGSAEAVPAAVMEQIVQDTPQSDEEAVQNMMTSINTQEAELMMSMIQHVPHQVHHVQQTQNTSQ